MSTLTMIARRRLVGLGMLVMSGVCMLGALDSCNDRLVAFTRYVDPCGTIFANCAQGDIQIRAAHVGDGCIDPACTVPGGCGGGIPLGLVTELCP